MIHDFLEGYNRTLVVNLKTKQVGLTKNYRSGAKNDLVGQLFGGGWVNTLSAVTLFCTVAGLM
jgi:hypothetical protein